MQQCQGNDQGTFYQKVKDVAHQLKQLVPYTPWSNAAEREIKKPNKGASCNQLHSRTSKYLWEDCLEMEACTRSNTAHDIYKLDGEVPKTVMSDETSDISQFCKLEWFDWVMF